MLNGRLRFGRFGPQPPVPRCLRARSVVGEADELAVGRVKAGAELLRGGGGEPVRQGGLELGAAPRDWFVRRMDSKPGGRPEHDLVLGVGADGQRLPRLESQPTADRHRDHDLPLGAHADDRRLPPHRVNLLWLTLHCDPARQRGLALERADAACTPQGLTATGGPSKGRRPPEGRGAWSRCPIDVVTIPLAVVTVLCSGCSRWSNLDRAPPQRHSFLPTWANVGPGLRGSRTARWTTSNVNWPAPKAVTTSRPRS